jgi:hypothetical protein
VRQPSHYTDYATSAQLKTNLRQGHDIKLFRAYRQRSGTNPADRAGIVGSSSGVKQPGPEADHRLPSRAKIKDGGAIPPISHSPSLSGA